MAEMIAVGDGEQCTACLALQDLPSDAAVERILGALPAAALLAVACTGTGLAHLAGRPQPWRRLVQAKLDAATCALHEAAALASPVDEGPEATSWWRKLALAISAGKAVRWDDCLSKRIYSTGAAVLLENCAHVAVAVGELVLLIGGRRMRPGPASGIAVVNCRTLEVTAAMLASDSAAPPGRFRHTACKVAPKEVGGLDRVLVLGGVSSSIRGGIVHPSAEALVLELLDAEARTVRWRTQRLEGDAPGGGEALFHHTACSFDDGLRVVVWGGDTMDFDADTPSDFERAQMDCLERAACAYELDVRTWRWRKIMTSGPNPGHRSLAEGVVYNGQLVVIGGTSEPKPLRAFEFGELAPMTPRVLDLRTWAWLPRPGGGEPRLPEPRTRFAAELRGGWLLGYGGRGGEGQALGDVFLLDLEALTWHRPIVMGEDGVAFPESCAGTLCGGLVLGGLVSSVPVPKADALLFVAPPALEAEGSGTEVLSDRSASGDEPTEDADEGAQEEAGYIHTFTRSHVHKYA